LGLQGDNLVLALILFLNQAVFELFGWFCCKILKVSSEIGTNWISLADLVSFGVLPGIYSFQMAGCNPLGVAPIFTLIVPLLCLSIWQNSIWIPAKSDQFIDYYTCNATIY